MSQIVTFSAAYNKPSKTIALATSIAQKVVENYSLDVTHYNMSDLGPSFGLAQHINDLDKTALNVIQNIKNAKVIIIATPVYKGSYPGLFKHFIDLLDPELLYEKPILLAATGGGDRHALMVEHQLRPLFGFFMAHTLPTAVYAASRDYNEDNQIISIDLQNRINMAVNQIKPFIIEQNNTIQNIAADQKTRMSHDYLRAIS